MKRIWISLVALAATGALAQEPPAQSGTPARLEAINGKQARVFLQGLEGGKLSFQAYKSTRNISVDISKINRLSFLPKYDAEAVEANFNAGDYPAVIAELGPFMEPYWEYMLVDNNLREAFCTLMGAHRAIGDFSKVRKAADLLMACGDPVLQLRGQVNTALAALASGDLQAAEKIRTEVASEAAGLYLQASIERAKQQPKAALKTISVIIAEYANAVEWLGPSELLCAHLYLDMIGSSPGITTNSALNTARQVKNMYTGTHVAADARALWVSLGGEAVEAAAAKEKAEREAAVQAAKAKREAEKQAKQDAAEVASATHTRAATTNENLATETESE